MQNRAKVGRSVKVKIKVGIGGKVKVKKVGGRKESRNLQFPLFADKSAG